MLRPALRPPRVVGRAACVLTVLGIDIGPDLCGVARVQVESIGRSRLTWSGLLSFEDVFKEVERAAVDLVAIECPEEVHQGLVRLRGAAALRSASQHIGDCKRIAGRVEGLLMARKLAYETTTARIWRAALCGRAAATDAQVKTALTLRCEMGKTNNHVRDAVGVAIWAGMRAGRERRTA